MKYEKGYNMNEADRLLNVIGNLIGCYLAGGAITSIFTNQPINDYDIYPKSQEDLENSVIYLMEDGYFNVFASDKALSFVKGETTIQIMLFDIFETPEKIFSCFDFTINMAALDIDKKEFTFHKDFLKHCSQRFLKFNINTKFPYISARRVQKYKDRGYTIGNGEFMKILLACQNKPINSWESFKIQMGGVYGDKIEIPEDTIFSLEAAEEALFKIKFDNSKEPNGYNSIESIIFNISKREISYFVENGKIFAKLYSDDKCLYEINSNEKNMSRAKLVKKTKLLGNQYYKVVDNTEIPNIFLSVYRKFKYIIGSEVNSFSPYIFVYNDIKYIPKINFNPKKQSIIELIQNDENYIHYNGYNNCITLEKAYINRIVPIEEIRQNHEKFKWLELNE